MKRIFKTIFFLAVLLSSLECFASGIDCVETSDIAGIENGKKITVSGTTDPNTEVTFKVYNKGKTKEDLISGELKDVLYFGVQKRANADGKFVFEFNLYGGDETKEGNYEMEVNYITASEADKLTETYLFISDSAKTEFLNGLNNMHKTKKGTANAVEFAAFKQRIQEYINKGYIKMPEIYTKLVEGVDIENDGDPRDAVFMAMMYDEDYTDIQNIGEAFVTGYNMTKLFDAGNSENIDKLLREDEEFLQKIGISGTESLAVYLDETFAFDRNAVCNAINGDDAINATTAKKIFEKKVIALAVGAQTKYSVIDILKALNSYLGLNFDKYDNMTAKQESFRAYLSNNLSTEPTVEEIKNAYQKACANVLDKTSTAETESTSPSSRGDGSSSSQSNSSKVITATNITPVKETVKRKCAFTDISSVEWAKEAIIALYENGYIDGTDEKNFNPNSNVKREEFLKMVISATKVAGKDKKVIFSDVVAGSWYEPFVTAAVENDIVNGIDNNNFGIGMNITRQDMSVMLWRVIKDKVSLPNKDFAVFSDKDSIAEYAKEAIEAMQKLGIITGMEDGSFCPKENATRAQAAVCISRILDYIK